jgi:hypothetical protein
MAHSLSFYTKLKEKDFKQSFSIYSVNIYRKARLKSNQPWSKLFSTDFGEGGPSFG